MSFDKTDTLTRGWPLVTDGVTFTGSGRTMLGAAAAVEGGSDHPVSRAVVERAAADVTAVRPARDRRSLPGQAIEAVVTGKRVIVGSQRHLGGISQATGTVSAVADLERTGKTVVLVVADGVLLGLIANAGRTARGCSVRHPGSPPDGAADPHPVRRQRPDGAGDRRCA
jgi:Cd2+/Zn2+-exporting ATPase